MDGLVFSIAPAVSLAFGAFLGWWGYRHEKPRIGRTIPESKALFTRSADSGHVAAVLGAMIGLTALAFASLCLGVAAGIAALIG